MPSTAPWSRWRISMARNVYLHNFFCFAWSPASFASVLPQELWMQCGDRGTPSCVMTLNIQMLWWRVNSSVPDQLYSWWLGVCWYWQTKGAQNLGSAQKILPRLLASSHPVLLCHLHPSILLLPSKPLFLISSFTIVPTHSSSVTCHCSHCLHPGLSVHWAVTLQSIPW